MIRGHDKSIVDRFVFDEPHQLRIVRWQLHRGHTTRVYGIKRAITGASMWRAMRVDVAKVMRVA